MNKKNLVNMIQDALSSDETLGECIDNIYIMEYDGVIIMSGSVPHAGLRILARKIASEVQGVDLLFDDLKIAPIQRSRVGVHIDWANGHIATG